jgi:hypothetical protein
MMRGPVAIPPVIHTRKSVRTELAHVGIETPPSEDGRLRLFNAVERRAVHKDRPEKVGHLEEGGAGEGVEEAQVVKREGPADEEALVRGVLCGDVEVRAAVRAEELGLDVLQVSLCRVAGHVVASEGRTATEIPQH